MRRVPDSSEEHGTGHQVSSIEDPAVRVGGQRDRHHSPADPLPAGRRHHRRCSMLSSTQSPIRTSAAGINSVLIANCLHRATDNDSAAKPWTRKPTGVFTDVAYAGCHRPVHGPESGCRWMLSVGVPVGPSGTADSADNPGCPNHRHPTDAAQCWLRRHGWRAAPVVRMALNRRLGGSVGQSGYGSSGARR